MQVREPVDWYHQGDAAERASVELDGIDAATEGGWVSSLTIGGRRVVSSLTIQELID